MATLRNLSVYLTMNSAQFRKEANKVDKRFQKLSRAAKKANKQMAGSIGKLSAALGGLSLKVMIKQAIDAGDRANKFSQQVGVATETITGLELAAELAGVGMRDVEVGLRRLGRSMSDAKAGLSTQVRAFSDLGISATDAQGNLRPVDDVLRDLSDKFSEMPDGAQKVARAQELLGRSGSLLIPMLNGGAKGLESQIELSRELGLVWSKEAAKGAELFNDQLHLLKKAGLGVATTFAKQLLPGMNRQLKKMFEFIKENRVEIVKWVKRGIVVATGAIAVMAAKFVILKTVVLANALLAFPALAKAFLAVAWMKTVAAVKKLGTAFALLKAPAMILVGKIIAVATVTFGIVRVIQAVYRATKDFGDKWKIVWSNIKDIAAAALDWVVAKVQHKFKRKVKALKQFANIAIEFYNKFADNKIDEFAIDQEGIDNLAARMDQAETVMATGFGNLGDLVVDFGSEVGSQITQQVEKDLETVSGLVEGAKQIVKDGVSAVGDFAGSMLDSGASMLGLGGNTDDKGDDEDSESGGRDFLSEFFNASTVEKFKGLAESVKNIWGEVTSAMATQTKAVYDQFEGMGNLLTHYGQKSKKLALLKQMLAVKEAIMLGKVAIQKEMAEKGFPAAIPGIAMAVAQTAASVSTIQGQFHDGIDSVPNTGTYLLEKGERVVDGRLNGDLKNFLAEASQPSSGQPVTLNVNGVSDPDLVVEALSSRRGELESILRNITSENLGQRP